MVRAVIGLGGLLPFLAVFPLAAQTPSSSPVAPGVSSSSPAPSPATEASQSPEVRERMAELLLLPKEKLWKELSKWPSFQKMTLEEQSAFLGRMAAMRRETQKKALEHAVKIGLSIPPDKHEAFTDDYLRERIHLHRKFVAEKRKGKTPSPEAFDRELDRRLTKKYGPGAKEKSGTAPNGFTGTEGAQGSESAVEVSEPPPSAPASSSVPKTR